MAKYEPKYWNEKGKYQSEYDKLYEKYVPKEGKAKTKIGNILRLASKYYYDHLNNGSCNVELFGEWKTDLERLLQDMPHRKFAIAMGVTVPHEYGDKFTVEEYRRWDGAIDAIMEYVIGLEVK